LSAFGQFLGGNGGIGGFEQLPACGQFFGALAARADQSGGCGTCHFLLL
jgi:hypothetical protein